MNNFIVWEKAVVKLSTALALILTIVGLVGFPLAALSGIPEFSEAPKVGQVLILGLGGWVGFIVIGTFINALGLILQIMSNWVKKL